MCVLLEAGLAVTPHTLEKQFGQCAWRGAWMCWKGVCVLDVGSGGSKWIWMLQILLLGHTDRAGTLMCCIKIVKVITHTCWVPDLYRSITLKQKKFVVKSTKDPGTLVLTDTLLIQEHNLEYRQATTQEEPLASSISYTYCHYFFVPMLQVRFRAKED